MAKAILSQNSETGSIIILVFKLYYRTTVIKKNHVTGTKHRHEEQWNTIEDTDTNSHNYVPLIFNKDAQSMHWRKGSLFHKWCWEN
jgi:hypothetical protein